MFTGLVREMGLVQSLMGNGLSYRLEIGAEKILPELKIGDSVAVNGACLTVVKLNPESFVADVMPETAQRTTLGRLHIGEQVNLERTLRVGDNLDGHFVTGHVEGVGRIVYRQEVGNAVLFSIACDDALLRHIVSKGSIAIDGISLTVVEVEKHGFSVSVIPHTAAVTTLRFKREGYAVNLETDIFGRYIEKYLGKDEKFWEHLSTL